MPRFPWSPAHSPAPIAPCGRSVWTATICALHLVVFIGGTGCAAHPQPRIPATAAGRTFTTSVLLHGKPLELHVSTPPGPTAPDVVVVSRNHRFSGGKAAFDAALLDAIHWIAPQPVRSVGTAVH